MITFHFHLQPQYKYELFHINFTSLVCAYSFFLILSQKLRKKNNKKVCSWEVFIISHILFTNPARIASSDWKSQKCYDLWFALSSKRVRWPPIFFYVFNIILSFSTCSQSFKKICTWEILATNVLKLWTSCQILIFFSTGQETGRHSGA